MTQREDPLIELGLREVLGGEQAPDLSERILAAAAQRRAARNGHAPMEERIPDLSAPRARKRQSSWHFAVVAASLLVALLTYSLWQVPTGESVAENERKVSEEIAKQEPTKSPVQPAETPPTKPVEVESEPTPRKTEPNTVVDPPNPEPKSQEPEEAPSQPVFPSDIVQADAVSDAEVIGYVNDRLQLVWREYGVRPSPQATDAEWCRRVYLDLLGRIPTLEEMENFLSDRRSHRREVLVENLLESEAYQPQLARHWSTLWSNWLIGRPASNEMNPLVSRPGLKKWLRDQIAANAPYDRFAYELIAAEGTNTPGEPEFNGAVNFLLDHLENDQISATNRVAKLFLGMRIHCTQCHGHPFNERTQEMFWGLNAFFKQAEVVTTKRSDGSLVAELTNTDFLGSTPESEAAEIYYELRNGVLKSIYPTFVDGQRISPNGLISAVNRREELARLVIESDYLSQALVNRLWSHFLGHGFTRPVDDMGPHHLPSHPQLLDALAENFVNSGHDTRRLIKWIVLSEAYQLSSVVTTSNAIDDPQSGHPPLFSRFYLRQMRPEELYNSLVVAANQQLESHDPLAEDAARDAWIEQFVVAHQTEENDESLLFDGSISQSLMMMNGTLMQQATSLRRGSLLDEIVSSQTSGPEKVDQLYLAALGRHATRHEKQLAHRLWQARGQDQATTLQDLWWALLNSNEFIMNR